MAQDDREDLFLLPQGHVMAFLAGTGWHLTGGSVYAVTMGSPAAHADVEQPVAGLAYRLETGIDDAWRVDIGFSAENTLWPQAIGAVLPAGAWRFGLGYGQWYRGGRVMEHRVRTVENPDGELREWREASRGEALMLTAAHRWSGPAWSAGFGVRAGLMRLVEQVTLEDDDLRGADLYAPGWALGARVAAEPSPELGVKVDAFYQGRTVLLGEMEGQTRYVIDPSAPNDPVPIQFTSTPLRHRLPARLALGAEVQPTARWRLRAEMLQVFWSGVQDHHVDQGEWTIGASFELTPAAALSLRDFVVWRNPHIEAPGTLTAHYLSLGSRLQLGRVEIDVAVADSRLMSSEAAGRVVVQVGTSVTW